MSFPYIKPYFIDIIYGVVNIVKNAHIKEILIMCSYNARKSRLFDLYFTRSGICVKYVEEEQEIIHSLMDVAENGLIDDSSVKKLYDLCCRYKNENIYFACTELSLIYGYNKAVFKEFKIIDTIESTIKQLF